MFKPLAIMIAAAMLSLGATAASAQAAPAGRAPEAARVSDRGGRNDNRDNQRDNGRGRGTSQDRVWVEDFAMVEEKYQEPGHYEDRQRQVLVPEQTVTVTERVLVPESKVLVTERALIPESKIMVSTVVHVPSKWVESDEVRVLGGMQFTFHHINYVWEHDEVRQIEKCIPAHYENVQIEKCIPAHYEDQQVEKCVPAHYETVCEKVFVEGAMKSRLVKKSTGGHFEVKARR